MHCSLAVKSVSVLLCSICFQHSLVYYANTTCMGNVFDLHVIDHCDCDSSKPGLNIRDSVNMAVLATAVTHSTSPSSRVQLYSYRYKTCILQLTSMLMVEYNKI